MLTVEGLLALNEFAKSVPVLKVQLDNRGGVDPDAPTLEDVENAGERGRAYGYNDGEKEGREEGHQEGFAEGYDKGLRDAAKKAAEVKA